MSGLYCVDKIKARKRTFIFLGVSKTDEMVMVEYRKPLYDRDSLNLVSVQAHDRKYR